MRVLIITNLFPNALRPNIASFNRQQFIALGKTCDVEILATLPWYPGQQLLSRFSTHTVAFGVPKQERIGGLVVHHPKTLYIPKVGTAVATPLFAASLLPVVRRYRSKIDVVLGAWAHPDGCAAVVLAKLLKVPVVVKIHGSDMNHVAKLPGPRRVMRALLPRADAIVAVSSALENEVAQLGVERSRIHQVMNGVDSQTFHLRDRRWAREVLGLSQDERIALYIGNLIEAKGVFDLQAAFASITEAHPNIHVYCVGDGNARKRLAASATEKFSLVGSQPFERIPLWLAACDLLVLPSWNEGTPNVILEALACGRRVLATPVGGIPDVLNDPLLGSMTPPKSPDALARSLVHEINQEYEPQQIAARGARGDWDVSAANLRAVLHSVL